MIKQCLIGALATVFSTTPAVQADVFYTVEHDAFVKSNGIGDGTGGRVEVKRDNDGSEHNRKAWLRFDGDMAQAIAARSGRNLKAQLNLQFIDTNLGTMSGSPAWAFEVYGLTDESADGWDESTIDYANAPGNAPGDGAGNAVDPASTSSLGTFTGYGKATGPRAFQSSTMLNQLAADTNGQYTAIIVRNTLPSGNTYVHAFSSKEGSTAPQLQLVESRNLIGANGEFEDSSGSFTTAGWGDSVLSASSHGGLIAGSKQAAFFDSDNQGSFFDSPNVVNSNFSIDLYFATADGTGTAGDRGMNLLVNFPGSTDSTTDNDDGKINLRVNGAGQVQVYNDQALGGTTGWKTLGALADMIEFSEDLAGDAGFDDVGDILNVHRIMIRARDWGTADASYDVLLSLAGDTEFFAAATGLQFFQNNVPDLLSEGGLSQISFVTSHGTGDFAVDSVYIAIPEPASLGAMAAGSLLLLGRGRRQRS